MRTRTLHTKIWSDSWFSELNAYEKLLFIYFLTNNHINLCGIYELPERIIPFETGLTAKQFNDAKKKLSERIIFLRDWIALKNIEKYDDYKGDKLLSAKERQLQEIPSSILEEIEKLRGSDRVSIEYQYSIDTSNSNSNNNKGGTGEKYPVPQKTAKNSHTACTPEELEEIANALNVFFNDVELVHGTILDKIADGSFNSKKYKTVYYTLKQWVRMGIERGTIKTKKSSLYAESAGMRNAREVKTW